MTAQLPRLWVGIDASKAHHLWVAVDDSGTSAWSKKIRNDETALLTGLAEVLGLADQVHWAVDITGTPSALLLALLAAHGQRVVYVPGRTVNRMSAAYRGEAKTDASALTGICPALEQAFDYADHKGPLILLTGYQTPAALRRCGQARLTSWLARRGVRHPETVADTALRAAHAQHTVLPGQDTAASITADIATQVLTLDERLKQIDRQIRDRFRSHPQAEIIESLPGMLPVLGAEFLVAVGSLAAYPDAGHLASAAGLVPVSKDSGRRTGNLHRPQRYSRSPRRVFYLSSQTSIIRDGPNRTYYLKKRAEGHKHIPAVITLARRRVDVFWALLRDNRPFTTSPPARTRTATAA